MADSLFFDVQIHDRMSKELDKIIGKANELQRALDLSKGGKGVDLKPSLDNAAKLERALYDIDKTMTRVSKTKMVAFDKEDSDKLFRFQMRLGTIRASLKRFKEELEKDPSKAKKRGLVDNLLADLNYNEAKYQANDFANTVQNKVNTALSEQTKLTNGLATAYDKVTEASKRTNKVQDQLVNQFNNYVSLYGAERLLKSVITIGGQFEIQHVALQNILGDMQEANVLFEQLQGLAVESPMTFRQIASYTKQLAAFSIPADELYDTTRRLADLSTGLGVDMSRLILAYGQVRSAAVLRGQELRQFTEAGIPLVQRLAEEFTKLNGKLVKTGDVFGLISKRQVPFEMVQKILWDMTNEGGQFYNMQALIAETLAGKWQKLSDVWEQALGRLAEGSSASGKALKGIMDMTIGIISNLEKFMPIIMGATMGFGGMSIIRNIGRLYTGGADDIMKNIKAAQQMNALEIEREHMLGRINATRKAELLSQNNSLRNSVSILASTGRLNNLELISLRLKKQITDQDLQQMLLEKSITQEQYKQITTTGRLGMMRMQMQNVFGSFFSLPSLAAMGIGVAFSYVAQFVMDLKQAEEESKRLREQIEENAKGIVESSTEVLKSTGEAVSQSQMYDAIGVMSEYLKKNSASWQDVESTMLSMTGPDVLTQKYNLLKEAIEAVNEANNAISKNPDLLERANNATGGYFTNGLLKDYKLDEVMIKTGKALDTYRKRIKDLLQTERKNLAPVFNELREKYSDFGNAVKNEGIEKNLVRQIELLRQFPDALRDFNYRFRDEYGNASGSARVLNEFYGEYKKYLGWMRTDIDAFVEYVKNDMQNTYGDIDFTNLNAKQKEEMTKYFRDYLKLYNITNSEAIDNYWKMIHKSVPSISVPVKLDKKQAENELSDWQAKLDEATNKQFTTTIKAQGDITSAIEAITKIRKEAEAKMKELGNIPIIAKLSLQGSKIDKSKLSALDLTPWNIKAIDEWNELVDKINGSKGAEKLGIDTTPKEKGQHKDKVLEDWKARISLLEKYRKELEELENYMTRAAAERKLREDKNYNSLWDYFANPNDYNASIDIAISKLGTKGDRKKYVEELGAKKGAENMRVYKDSVKDAVSELQRMLNIVSENYRTYKKWLDLTGDSELAARIAGVTQNTSYADYLKDEMSKQLKKTNLALSAEDVFGLKESEAKKLGKDNEIFKVWEEWQKNQQKIKKDQLDLYEDAIKNSKSYEDKIADINRKLKEQVEAINSLARTDEERIRLINNANDNAQKEIGKTRWEQFKEQNDWGEIFGDIENVSLKKLKKLIKAMQSLQKTTSLNAQEMKAWQEGMNKAIDTMNKKDSIDSMRTAMENYTNAIIAYERLQKQGEYIEQGNTKSIDKEFLDNNGNIDLEKYKDALDVAEKQVDKARKALVKTINAFSKDLQKLGSSLDSIAKSVGGKIGDVLGGFGSIFGGIGKSIDAISSVDLEAKGFSGFVSKAGAVATTFTAMIDMNKSLSKILPDTDDLYEKSAAKKAQINQLREAIDDYATAVVKANEAEKNWFAGTNLSKLQSKGEEAKKVIEAYNNTANAAQTIYKDSGAGWKKAIIPVAAAASAVVAAFTLGAATPGLVAAWGAALTAAGTVAGTAAGAIVAAGVGYAIGQGVQSGLSAITYKNNETSARQNMRVQTRHKTFFRSEKTQNLEEWARENLNVELFDKDGWINLKAAQAVLDSGATLVGETEKTLKRLMELREQWDEFIKEIEDYAGQIGLSLVDNMTNAIWDWLSNGEDALDKFKEYANDTWRSIAQDIVKTFMKVTVLDKYADLFKEMFKAWSLGEITTEDLITNVANASGAIAKDFETALPVAKQITEILDKAFSEQGYNIKNSDSSSSSSSRSTIQSVTESTADIIASYINAIRADTSVNRLTLSQILIAVQTQTEMPVIARAQLAQLQVIAGNTGKNAEVVGRIYDLLHSISPDGLAWKIK